MLQRPRRYKIHGYSSPRSLLRKGRTLPLALFTGTPTVLAVTISQTIPISAPTTTIGLIVRIHTMVVARPSFPVAALVPLRLAIPRVIVIPAPGFARVTATVATVSGVPVLAVAFVLFLALGTAGVVGGTAPVALGLTLLRRVGLSAAAAIVVVIIVVASASALFIHFVGEEILGVG